MINRLADLTPLLVVISLAGAPGTIGVSAQALAAEALDAPPPGEIAPAIKDALGKSAAARVTMGATTLELWWAALTAASWESLEEGAIVGAMRVTGPFEEIRGKTVAPGVYTLRYGLQPQNGDHLGVSETREFLLVSPAKSDTAAGPLSFDDMVAIAKQTTGTSHPASLSINPSATEDPALTPYTADPDLQGVVFEAGTLHFGLILQGVIEQ